MANIAIVDDGPDHRPASAEAGRPRGDRHPRPGRKWLARLDAENCKLPFLVILDAGTGAQRDHAAAGRRPFVPIIVVSGNPQQAPIPNADEIRARFHRAKTDHPIRSRRELP
ncbi:MAG: hypothetical protein KGK01_16710 [Bradyrhizobium sp.]|uniref:hypothetical protein n=1 Tax=Bradyrhizobium sp. TaxID=376 RepID=UPI00239B2745|nr:hypothetical protein [Bradyrhizobium sp.]MDE2069347.1 hypothetical protein [Bradyrhizobium sp.]MDE2244008.1 hypothetical protein [Bradyrhizobium sp.]